MIKVSIVIPVYNVLPFLSQCLQSVTNQTYTNIEIIIIDDGSTDGSGEYCDEYGQNESRAIIIHKENGGLSSARNVGLKYVTGDYFIFIDSDDKIRLDTIEVLVSAMTSENADICLFGASFIDERDQVIGEELWESSERIVPLSSSQFWNVYESHRIIGAVVWSKMYANKFAKTIVFPEGEIHEDEWVLLPIIHATKAMIYLKEKFYFYRQVSNSIMHREFSTRNLIACDIFLRRMDYFLDNNMNNHAKYSFFRGAGLLAYANKALDRTRGDTSKLLRKIYFSYKNECKRFSFHDVGLVFFVKIFIFSISLELYSFLFCKK